MGPFYITQPNPTAFRPNPTHDALARTQPDSPTTPNPWKGDIFQINVANSKIQNRPKSYIGYNYDACRLQTVRKQSNLTITVTVATTVTLIKFRCLSLSNQTNPTHGCTQPMSITGSVIVHFRFLSFCGNLTYLRRWTGEANTKDGLCPAFLSKRQTKKGYLQIITPCGVTSAWRDEHNITSPYCADDLVRTTIIVVYRVPVTAAPGRSPRIAYR